MLNCGLGILLLPVAGVALVIKGGELLPLLQMAFGNRGGCMEVLLCTGVCTIAAMNDMATPSVSLEGKNLWLAQSLPVTPWQVLRAKLKVQLALTAIPALVPLVCVALVLPLTPALPLIFVTALSYIVFSACLGLTLGVIRANLTWTNELAPVKQSLAVAIAMFGGWAYALLLAGLYLLGLAQIARMGLGAGGLRLACVGRPFGADKDHKPQRVAFGNDGRSDERTVAVERLGDIDAALARRGAVDAASFHDLL